MGLWSLFRRDGGGDYGISVMKGDDCGQVSSTYNIGI